MSDVEGSESIRTKLTRRRSLWRLSTLEDILRSLRPSERLLLYGLTAFLTVGSLALLVGLNNKISVVVPAKTGSLKEGIIGSPRFLNPILAVSSADEDLTQLVYSGLTHAHGDGTIIPDLAEKYEISDDGEEYTFTIRDNAMFHDGTPVSAADVIFTVQAAQNPEVKSPRRADWEGVSISSPDAKTVVFKLQHAYAPFLENTSLGVLPKHLWGSVAPTEFPFHALNARPIGTGPYRVISLETDSSGAATGYVLEPFEKNAQHTAFLSTLRLKFYHNEEALIAAFNRREIDSIASISPSKIDSLRRKDVQILHVPLPRVFGVFFNQGRSQVLADAAVREALETAIDKRALVNSVLRGYGTVLEGPVPPGIFDSSLAILDPARPVLANSAASTTAHTEKAREILKKGGWKYDEDALVWKKGKQKLSFALATGDAPELSATAQRIAQEWQAAGINVSIHVYPVSELNTNVIRPREYDAILFGEVVGRTPDLFAFWHSSQRNDPGLNLAMYANTQTDRLLANARATTNRKEREKLYRSFSTAITKDRPAIFLFAPEYMYIVPKKLQGVKLGVLTMPAERFLNVRDWYTDVERVWNFFTSETQAQ